MAEIERITTFALTGLRSYGIAWIALWPHERAAAISMLDEVHDRPDEFIQKINDENSYTFGRIGDFNVIIAALSAGESGPTSTTRIVTNGLRASCPQLRIAISVGTGSGIASNARMLLGDVVISYPDADHGGVVQYKMKNANGSSKMERADSLGPPYNLFRNALAVMQTNEELGNSRTQTYLAAFEKNENMKHSYGFPGAEKDPLRSTTATRKHPMVHFGTIAASATVVHTSDERDTILEWLGQAAIKPLCLDTEAAYMYSSFPMVAIRGICDYADDDKTEVWRKYAAATAAACAKDFLRLLVPQDVYLAPNIKKSMGDWAGAYRKGVEPAA